MQETAVWLSCPSQPSLPNEVLTMEPTSVQSLPATPYMMAADTEYYCVMLSAGKTGSRTITHEDDFELRTQEVCAGVTCRRLPCSPRTLTQDEASERPSGISSIILQRFTVISMPTSLHDPSHIQVPTIEICATLLHAHTPRALLMAHFAAATRLFVRHTRPEHIAR